MFNNKRYKDIFSQYIYKGEPTPISIGSLVVLGFCFVLLIIATFSQIDIPIPNFQGETKSVSYMPTIPIMIFIIYLLGRNFSIILFTLYLLIGLFWLPIFLFGGGIENFQNYIFGYFLGFLPAIIISGTILNICQNIKARLLSAILGVFSIHITGLIYCLVLTIFKVINFSIIVPIFQALTLHRFLYDLLFSVIIILVAPYIKNIFWICMKPKMDRKKQKLIDTRNYPA